MRLAVRCASRTTLPAPGAPTLLLASSSPRRRALIAHLPLRVSLAAPDVDESPAEGEDPWALARRLAEAKARAVMAPVGGLVLSADTVVVLAGQSLGKPVDTAEARDLLARLRGRTHRVVTAVCIRSAAGALRSGTRTTRVRMRHYSAAEIEAYAASGEPLDKAGG